MRYYSHLTITKNWSGTIVNVTGYVDAVPYPPMPGIFTFTLTKEIDKMFFATIGLPGPSASDVVAQELSIQVGDATPVVKSYPADALLSDEFECGEVGTVVTASLVDVDGAGQRSPNRDERFTVKDTIAPPQPGEFTMTITRQT